MYNNNFKTDVLDDILHKNYIILKYCLTFRRKSDIIIKSTDEVEKIKYRGMEQLGSSSGS